MKIAMKFNTISYSLIRQKPNTERVAKNAISYSIHYYLLKQYKLDSSQSERIYTPIFISISIKENVDREED